MEKENKFLPLGSIIIVEKTTQKLIIIARGMLVENKYYDYGAFLYPQGLVEDSLVYFNEDQIAKVVFRGFTDEDDELFMEYIDKGIEQWNSEEGSRDIQKAEQHSQTTPEPSLIDDDDDPFASVRDLEDDE